jgi:hypothetical protein
VLLDFADEHSVVSSRFITSSIVLLRAHLASCAGAGLSADIRALPDAAAREVVRPLPAELAERTEFTFLGRVVPGDGVPAWPDQRQRREHGRLGAGSGAG